MQIGIDSFIALLPDPATGYVPSAAERMANLLDEITFADQFGVDIFGVGEHQRKEFLDSSTAIVLAAGAARTKRIRLTSSVTVLGAADPVRVVQDYAALDLVSNGRAEIVVGRGAFHEAFPLFGFQNENHDALFAEKLDLLLKLRDSQNVVWNGRYRSPLTGQGIYPRPKQQQLPIWLGVGGTRQSFIRAGVLGLPLMLAVIGGNFHAFRPLVDLYRAAGQRAGHPPERLSIGIHAKGFVADTDGLAKEAFFPGWHYLFTTIGAEREWPPATRGQFEAMCGPEGVFLIGDPKTVATKIRAADAALGGVSRMTLEMSSASKHPVAMRRSIELLGMEVAPEIRRRLMDQEK